MPRKAREKSAESIYHVMCRSVSEYLLFRDDDDKAYYLGLLKRYTERYKCSIYAYCLMDNHLHIHLDPNGFDVSKFMHCTNVAYVRYYNRKYNRHGPVFQERFESRILDSDEYNLTVSAYIHNNPKDMEGFAGREEQYQFSSYGVYLGIRKDYFGIVDLSFVMDLFNTHDVKAFAQKYKEFANHHRDLWTTAAIDKKISSAVANEYRSGRRIILRDNHPAKLISYISNRLMVSNMGSLMLKTKKRLMEYRALCAYSMRVLCGMSYQEICKNMYNITVSACSNLCSRGYDLIKEKIVYGQIFNELIGVNAF
ncbi:MAG: transposase [Clostridia bacterium]|nr:transposase [Clostridia bacterium]